MPFTAILNDQRVNILEVDDPYALRGVPLACPYCDGPMVPVVPMLARWHFRHKPDTSCQAVWSHHPESEDHLAGKQFVFEYLRRNFPDDKITLEERFEIGDRRRIADVCRRSARHAMVYEIQLSVIPMDEIIQRTVDYMSIGVECVWIFGPRFYRDESQFDRLHTALYEAGLGRVAGRLMIEKTIEDVEAWA